MTYVKWTFRLLLALLVAATLHYTLPGRDIVRIVGVENRRVDFGDNVWFWAQPDVGSGENTTRDVRFIMTVRPSGRERVYRNEDTGWGWPPYFKLNSSNLQARAADNISSSDAPRWVAITHYGWRSEFLTIFPNAIRITPVEGPDVRLIPWFNIVFVTIFALAVLTLWRFWQIFRRTRIAPALARVDSVWERVTRRFRGGPH